MYEASNTMFDHSEKRYSLLFSYKSEESESKHAAIALSLDNDVYIEVRIYIPVYNIILKSLKQNFIASLKEEWKDVSSKSAVVVSFNGDSANVEYLTNSNNWIIFPNIYPCIVSM